MKFLLKELINPNTALLNDTQKAVLLTAHISTSPEMAYADTNTSENLVKARQGLHSMGMVVLGDSEMATTKQGNEMMVYHNLVDNAGQLTDEGQGILDSTEDVGGSFNDQAVQEQFKFLSSL